MLKKSIAVAASLMLLSFGAASRSSAQSSAGQAKAGDAIEGTGLVNGGAFTIANGGRYSDRDGRPGTITFDAAEQILTFHGVAYDGQRARYENVKAPTIHIMGPSSRNVLDCDRG